MTGHGEAHCQKDGLAATVDVRSINNKYFKLVFRAAEAYLPLESQVESLVRESIRRGSIQLVLRMDRKSTPDDFQLNEVVLAGYRRQLEAIEHHLQLREPIRLESLLGLPGVVSEFVDRRQTVEAEWPVIREAIVSALKHLAQMRLSEGQHMEANLKDNLQVLSQYLTQIESRSPIVVEAYCQRFQERMKKWLSQSDLELSAQDLAREVGLFAERSDISEETVRLRSHFEQFGAFLQEAESSGRKLEFLTQEIFRETNTIGSKANDAVISKTVIEMKGVIERIREMIQNVE